MAPFLTHLVIGERVWAALDGAQPQAATYGTFLFGCLAPDVDKFDTELEQETTHFVAKDEAGSHTWLRSQRFLDQPSAYLRAPFRRLAASERAFVMGYLCHVASDEITSRLAHSMQPGDVGTAFPHADALLTAMDPRVWGLAHDQAQIVSALASAVIPETTLRFVPEGCLSAMRQIVLPQVSEGGGLEPYLRMVRRHRRWLRHGLVSDDPDDPGLESEIAAYRSQIEADLPLSASLIDSIDLEFYVKEAMDHSLQQLGMLSSREGQA
jgi:hypothetical protein